MTLVIATQALTLLAGGVWMIVLYRRLGWALEQIAVLTARSLPAHLEAVSRLRLKPGDTLVLRFARTLSREHHERLVHDLNEYLKPYQAKGMVFDNGLTVHRVLRKIPGARAAE